MGLWFQPEDSSTHHSLRLDVPIVCRYRACLLLLFLLSLLPQLAGLQQTHAQLLSERVQPRLQTMLWLTAQPVLLIPLSSAVPRMIAPLQYGDLAHQDVKTIAPDSAALPPAGPDFLPIVHLHHGCWPVHVPAVSLRLQAWVCFLGDCPCFCSVEIADRSVPAAHLAAELPLLLHQAQSGPAGWLTSPELG